MTNSWKLVLCFALSIALLYFLLIFLHWSSPSIKRLKQSLGKQQSFPQAADIWHTTSLPGAAQVIPQMPTFINYNNNASTGVSLAPSGIDCAHVQRPSVGLIQQVVECFKRSTKKEMLPSQVYVEME